MPKKAKDSADWDGIEVRRDSEGAAEVAWTFDPGNGDIMTIVLAPGVALEAAKRLLSGAMKAYALDDN